MFFSSDLVASDLKEKLPYPNYSSERFRFGKGDQLIFDDGKEGQWNNYSDRFREWDREAYSRANQAVKNFPNHEKQCSGRYWQAWLKGYHGVPVSLHKIYACTNIAGHPIWAFSYDVEEK